MVGGTRDHSQVVLTPKLGLRPAVEIEYHLIALADDQQRGCGQVRQPGTGRIRAGHRGKPRPRYSRPG